MNMRGERPVHNLQTQPLTFSLFHYSASFTCCWNICFTQHVCVCVCYINMNVCGTNSSMLTVKCGLISAETLHHWSAALTFLFGLPNGWLANSVAPCRRSTSQEHILHCWWKDTLTFVRIVSLGLWEVDINVSQVQSESWQLRSEQRKHCIPLPPKTRSCRQPVDSASCKYFILTVRCIDTDFSHYSHVHKYTYTRILRTAHSHSQSWNCDKLG